MSSVVPTLHSILAQLPETRKARGLRHPLGALLTAAGAAMLCGAGAQSTIARWIADLDPYWRHRFGLRHPRGPQQSTLSRVFGDLDVAAFETALSQWTQALLARALTDPLPPAPGVPLP